MWFSIVTLVYQRVKFQLRKLNIHDSRPMAMHGLGRQHDSPKGAGISIQKTWIEWNLAMPSLKTSVSILINLSPTCSVEVQTIIIFFGCLAYFQRFAALGNGEWTIKHVDIQWSPPGTNDVGFFAKIFARKSTHPLFTHTHNIYNYMIVYITE